MPLYIFDKLYNNIYLCTTLFDLSGLVGCWFSVSIRRIINKFGKSVRNRCFVIEVFGSAFVLSPCFLDFSVGVGAFVTGLSQNSSFFVYDF